MIDIRFLRENPEAVKENIRKKFQDAKLPLVDEVVRPRRREAPRRDCRGASSLKAARNKLSKANGPLYGQLKKCDDEAKKAELQAQIDREQRRRQGRRRPPRGARPVGCADGRGAIARDHVCDSEHH